MHLDRSSITTLVRRRRRPLAAVSAGLAVLFALGALAGPPADPTSPAPLGPGLVAMPLALAGVNAVVRPGDIIDIVAVPDDATGARIIAREASVLSASASGFGSSSTTAVVIAVGEPDALALADAASTSTLTALIHR